jgi:DNA repair protein RadC
MIESEKKVTVSSPEKMAQIIKSILESYEEHERDKEHFYVIGLNNRNVTQYIDLVSVGTVNESLVHPREVFRYAIMKNVSSIIMAHNHPSGDTAPSQQDIGTTKRIEEASKILGITLLDHIIVGEGFSYLSLKEAGYL